MNIRTIATLAVAVVLGLIAVILLNEVLGSTRSAQRVATTGGATVVVASAPIPRGMPLQPVLLKVAHYPRDAVPAGAFGAVAQLAGASGGQRFALHDMTLGEPILPADVSGPGGRLTLASAIDPGMQAVAIRSSDVAGVGGFVLPGDRVDVLLTRSTSQGGAQESPVTQIIAENVRVMGIDQTDNEAANKPSVSKSVTLEVTPPQAQVIALGQSVGTVSLSLRHVSDAVVLNRRATTLADLGFFRPPPSMLPPAPSPPRAAAAAAEGKPGEVPLYGPGIVRVTRVTETTGYRLGGR